MKQVDRIQTIKKIAYSKYANVSSREKLVAYTIKYLDSNGIPTNFNNICIAAFKLFPERFYFSEEFKDYPHIEMLNRTILHLRPKERNYAQGSVKTLYRLTKVGRAVADQVEIDIKTGSSDAARLPSKPVDIHKKTAHNDLHKIKTSDIYKCWLESGEVKTLDAWRFFDVTPFTQYDRIKQDIKQLKIDAKSQEAEETVTFLTQLERVISR